MIVGMAEARKTPTYAPDGLADGYLAAIVESSFDAIVSKNLDGIIQSWNPAAEALFGYTAAETIGQSILMLIPDGRRDEEERIISRLRAGERIETFETVRQRKDGTLIPISITISPIRGADGRIVGASKIARDISAVRDSERRIRLLLREVNHRVKNQYAVILSIIRETANRSADPAEFEETVRERIMGLARSHDLLVDADWNGAVLTDLIHGQLAPFGHEGLITVSGPMLTVNPAAVQNLGMAFHELGTNSAKHGVLAQAGGSITISWRIRKNADGVSQFTLEWDERLGAPARKPPGKRDRSERRGFGTVVLRRVAPQSLGGTADYEHDAASVRWTIRAPMENVAAD